MERSRTLDSTDCKHAIRHLNGTDSPQLNACDYSSSSTSFDDTQRQRLPNTKQTFFHVTKLNTYLYGAFVWITNSQLFQFNSKIKSCLLVLL